MSLQRSVRLSENLSDWYINLHVYTAHGAVTHLAARAHKCAWPPGPASDIAGGPTGGLHDKGAETRLCEGRTQVRRRTIQRNAFPQ